MTTTIAWPTTGRAFTQIQYDEGLVWDVEITVARAGNVITQMLPGWRWKAVVRVPDEYLNNRADRQKLEALHMRLRGGAVRLSMFNQAKTVRVGTLTGAPLVKTAIGIGATSVVLKNCNGTVAEGDLLGLGGQRVMVVGPASPVSGEMTVVFEPPTRQAVGADTAVIWDRPTSDFILTSAEQLYPYAGSSFPGFAFEMIEGW